MPRRKKRPTPLKKKPIARTLPVRGKRPKQQKGRFLPIKPTPQYRTLPIEPEEGEIPARRVRRRMSRRGTRRSRELWNMTPEERQKRVTARAERIKQRREAREKAVKTPGLKGRFKSPKKKRKALPIKQGEKYKTAQKKKKKKLPNAWKLNKKGMEKMTARAKSGYYLKK